MAPVPVDDSEVLCQPSKKQGTCVSADSANDAVQVDETVRVPQHLINGNEFKGIDVGADYNSVLALAKAIN